MPAPPVRFQAHPGTPSLARPATEAVDRVAVRRAALWALLAAKLVASWGVRWDIQWHLLIGRDSFWIAPHVMTYAGVSAIVGLSFGVLAWERARGTAPSPGFRVAACGIATTVAAAPIDDLWHRLFGLDVTLWSPPHLMGILGGVANSVGCLLIAREVYPAGHRARPAALIVTAALLYSGLHLTTEPAWLVAYRHGGVRFHTYAGLAALLLPLALVPAARLTGRRAAPLLVLVVVLLSGVGAAQVARAGFALLQPVSVIEQASAADPESPIALAHAIARKNRSGPGARGPWLPVLALIPAAAMVVADARRRPIAASVAHAAAVFAINGWALAHSPAFGPLVPSVAETALALALTLAAAAVGADVARRLAGAIAARAA